MEIEETRVDFNPESSSDDFKLKSSEGIETETIALNNIEKHIFKKALNIKSKQYNSLYQFEYLKKELSIDSVLDLLDYQFLGDIEIKFIKPINNKVSNKDKLEAVLSLLETVFRKIKEEIVTHVGSEFEIKDFQKIFKEPKIKTVMKSRAIKNIVEENWYILDSFYGTSEEEEFVKLIQESFGNLGKKYEKIYLLRNEEVYKIYDFAEGRGFQPDFILFLKGKNNNLHYQVFIEPKGDEFLDSNDKLAGGKEGWKENFLIEISEKYGLENVIKQDFPKYRLIGLPFFNNNHNEDFKADFDKLILNGVSG